MDYVGYLEINYVPFALRHEKESDFRNQEWYMCKDGKI